MKNFHVHSQGAQKLSEDQASGSSFLMQKSSGNISQFVGGNNTIVTDLRGLQPGQIIVGGIPEKGKMKKRMRVISNNGIELVLCDGNTKDDETGKQYYIFVGMPRGEYKMYAMGTTDNCPICTLILDPMDFLISTH